MRSVFGRLLTAQLATVLIALLTLGFSLSYLYSQYYFDMRERNLVQIGSDLATEFANGPLLSPRWWDRVRTLVNAAQILADTDIFVVSSEGLILVSTSTDDTQELRLSEEDAVQIFSGGIVAKRTYFSHINEAVFAVAVPITTPVGVAGAVVLHSPIQEIIETINGGRMLIIWATILAGCLAVIGSWFSAKRIATPLHQMRSVALEMAGGNFEQRVQVPGRDEVAELAMAFNELAAQLSTTIRALEAEKSQTESVIAGLNEGVLAVDTHGYVLLLNQAASTLLHPLYLEVGSNLSSDVDNPLIDLLNVTYQRVLSTGKVQQSAIEVDNKSLLVSVAPVTTSEGDLLGAVALLQDESERQRLDKMRRDFVADISHELRTPLTSIFGFAQAIADDVVTGEDQMKRYLKVIMDESLRLVRLTNTMLDLSRIESDHVKLQLKPVQLAEVVGDTLTSLQPQLNEKQVVATIQIASDLPLVMADEDRLEQILLNLLDNATRHAPVGGEVTISAALLPEQTGSVQVEVKDNGPGIPPDELPFIWERFYKADKARKQNRMKGTGLGLVIVKQLVERHGGTVMASNLAAGGACFTFTLPTAQQQDTPEA
jgi:two-component system sensor histidine kinase ResE